MHKIESRARLAERAATAPIARPALPIRRAAAEEALRDGDGPVELTFDVVRVGGATEAISMILERSDLERTLQSADGEELALVFDPDELERRSKARKWSAGAARDGGRPDRGRRGDGRQRRCGLGCGGASGTGYVGSGGWHGGDRERCRRCGCERQGYVVPAGGTEAIVNDAGAAGVRAARAMWFRRVARRRS